MTNTLPDIFWKVSGERVICWGISKILCAFKRFLIWIFSVHLKKKSRFRKYYTFSLCSKTCIVVFIKSNKVSTIPCITIIITIINYIIVTNQNFNYADQLMVHRMERCQNFCVTPSDYLLLIFLIISNSFKLIWELWHTEDISLKLKKLISKSIILFHDYKTKLCTSQQN